MKIAGAVVRVQPLFQSTREYCKPFLADQESEFFVDMLGEDLPYEQTLLDQEAVEQGLKFRKFPEPFLERSIIQRRVADYLVGRNTVMLHGSTVAVDGKAYLFTAPCGTGKSTHTRLWRELFGQRAVMVNDDKPFLQITSTGVFAYGSPWSGKHGLSTNVCVPLNGICSLHRGKENSIHRTDTNSLMGLLCRQVHIPAEESLEQKAYALVEQLAQAVPLWMMSCNKERNAAQVAYDAMSGYHG